MKSMRFLPMLLLLGLGLWSGNALLGQAAPNDNACNAIVLQVDSSCNGVPNGDNAVSGPQPAEPFTSCIQAFSAQPGFPNSVWYRFTAPISGLVRISTDFPIGTNPATAIGLFDPGLSCGFLPGFCEISCAWANGTDGATISLAEVIPGKNYYIQVSLGPPPNAAGGSFCIEVTDAAGMMPPANDDLCNATPLVVGVGCAGAPNGSNDNATLQCDEPVGSCFAGGNKTVWYKIQVPPSGNLTISTDIPVGGTNDDTELALYRLPGGDCSDLSDLVPIDCDQDGGSVVDFNSVILAGSLTPGDTVYAQVSGWQNLQGSFCIEATSVLPPANDALCNADTLTVGEGCNGMPNGDNTNATLQVGEPVGGCFIAPNATVWYVFTAPLSGDVRISTDIPAAGTNQDTEMALYSLTGTCANLTGLTAIDCDQQSGTVVGGGKNAVIEATGLAPGGTYYVQVSGWNNTQGTFCIEVNEIPPFGNPPNDTACNAVFLPATGETFQLNNFLATVDPQETALLSPLPSGSATSDSTWSSTDPEIENSMWYFLIAPPSGRVLIDLCGVAGTNINTQVALFRVGDCSDFSTFELIAANDDSPETCVGNNDPGASAMAVSCLVPGEPYYLLVDGFAQAFGDYAIRITSLPGGPFTDATLTSADPACGNDGIILLGRQGGTPPLDYAWTGTTGEDQLYDLAPGSYTLTVTDACGSSFTLSTTLTDNIRTLEAGPDIQSCDPGTFSLGGTPTLSGELPDSRRTYVNMVGQNNSADTLVMHRPLRSERVVAQEIEDLTFDYLTFAADPALLYGVGVVNSQPRLYQLDLAADTPALVAPVGVSSGNQVRGLAYDRTSGQAYVLVRLVNQGISALFSLDLSSGALGTAVNLNLEQPGWLAIDTAGTFYAFDRASDSIYQFDPASGALGAQAQLSPVYAGGYDAAFDPKDNGLYLTAQMGDRTGGVLLRLDPGTGIASRLGGHRPDAPRRGLAIQPPTASATPSLQWTAINGPALDNDTLPNPSVDISTSTDAQYVATVQNLCGTLTDTVAVRVSLDLAVTASSPDSGEVTATVNGGIGPYTYQWSNGSTDTSLTGLAGGTYSVTVTDAAGCTAASEQIEVDPAPVSLDATDQLGLRVYPNPAQDRLTIEASLSGTAPLTVTLYTLQGQRLLSQRSDQPASRHTLHLNLAALPAGVYVLAVRSAEGTAYHRVMRE